MVPLIMEILEIYDLWERVRSQKIGIFRGERGSKEL